MKANKPATSLPRKSNSRSAIARKYGYRSIGTGDLGREIYHICLIYSYRVYREFIFSGSMNQYIPATLRPRKGHRVMWEYGDTAGYATIVAVGTRSRGQIQCKLAHGNISLKDIDSVGAKLKQA